jgi:hypothetical protein
MRSSLMMEAVRTSETSVDNHFTRQYNPEDNSEHHGGVLIDTHTILLGHCMTHVVMRLSHWGGWPILVAVGFSGFFMVKS